MSKAITLAVISDLHYRQHEKDAACRPAAATEVHGDPIAGLFDLIQAQSQQLRGDRSAIADFLLCPGDICDRADQNAFKEGWSKLNSLRDALGAKALIASTGNHEVNSRAEKKHQKPGNVLNQLDPIGFLQELNDYPTKLLASDDRRWIYWGRGYEIIETDSVFFLIVNSSYFHITTQSNEYERGRISDAALKALQSELSDRVKKDKNRLFIMLLHHHPIDHQELGVDLGAINMNNGSQLMQVLLNCKVAWLVIHGHKHFPRLMPYQNTNSPGRAIVFGAGSAGAQLGGAAAKTRLQFYLIDAFIEDQSDGPAALGHVRAFSWSGFEWEPAMKKSQGLPMGCGYKTVDCSFTQIADELHSAIDDETYSTWDELVEKIPELRALSPSSLPNIQDALALRGVECVWPNDHYFPTQLAKRRDETDG